MSIENAIQAKSVQYAALRAGLRAKARRWVEERTPASAVNARRQLNQAYDAGVSATIEMLRELEPLNLTAEEIDTLIALREGEALVIPSRAERDRSFDVGSYPVGYGVEAGDRSDVRRPRDASEGPARDRGGSTPDERETDENIEPENSVRFPCDVDGRMLALTMRVVWTTNPKWGAGHIKFLSSDGKRAKVAFDSLPDFNESISPRELRMLDGTV